MVLPAHSRALHLLQRVRDEAHRFALAYHRTLRAQAARESVLDEIPGVGEVRKRKLFTRFGSLKKMRQASRRGAGRRRPSAAPRWPGGSQKRWQGVTSRPWHFACED